MHQPGHVSDWLGFPIYEDKNWAIVVSKSTALDFQFLGADKICLRVIYTGKRRCFSDCHVHYNKRIGLLSDAYRHCQLPKYILRECLLTYQNRHRNPSINWSDILKTWG